jgi:hypothetical protein
MKPELNGWQLIVFQIISQHFSRRVFYLDEVYAFVEILKPYYPLNEHPRDKIRQILQQLRDQGLLTFLERGTYQLTDLNMQKPVVLDQAGNHIVYLLSNQSMPMWVKIGHTNSIERRLKELYNTSTPLPFHLEDTIQTTSRSSSLFIEKHIHALIDTINPSLRKETEASRREFFQLSPERGKEIFRLTRTLLSIS